MTIETLLLEERQANNFARLVNEDDEAMKQEGYGHLVSFWISEKTCIDGIAAIYGLRGHL